MSRVIRLKVTTPTLQMRDWSGLSTQECFWTTLSGYSWHKYYILQTAAHQ